MPKQVIRPENGPPTGGPYSPVVIASGFIFTAGMVGLKRDTDKPVVVEGGIREQTKQALENIGVILQAAGSSLDNVVKTTVYLADINDFAAMNEVYGTFFQIDPPARTTMSPNCSGSTRRPCAVTV